MPNSNRHPITGCRTDSIFGLWLCPPQDLEPLQAAAYSIVAQGDAALARCADESKKQDQEKKPYTIEDGIAHISMAGPMTKYPTSFGSLFGGTSTVKMRDCLRMIKQDPSIKACMIHCDSPGGTADGTAELAASVRDLNSTKPVFVHAEDKMTSAALWVSSQASRVTCGPAAAVGSLGTMMLLYDTSKQNAEMGQGKPVLITTGKYKGIGVEGLPITDDHKKELQRRTDGINKPFQEEVFSARGLTGKKFDEIRDEILTARVFVGEDALRVGLVDEICTTEEALCSLNKYLSASMNSRQTGQQTQQNNAKVATRSPILSDKTVANKRSKIMPLTAEQLKVAGQLPGGAGITEENADVVLFQIASTQQSDLKIRQAEHNAGAQKVSDLELEVSKLQSQLPKQMDPSIATAKAELAIERTTLMAEKGLLLPTQVAKLKTAFIKDGKPNEIFLNDVVQKTVFDLLSDNKPNGLLKDISHGQPAPQVTPGAGGGNKEVPSFARINKVRQDGGLSPLTAAEYQNKYGVSPAAN